MGATAGGTATSRRVRACVPAHGTPCLCPVQQKHATARIKYMTNWKWVSWCIKKNKNKKKSFGMFFCDIRCIARELRGYSDQEGPKPRETADYMGSQESDTCLIMNSDAQRGPSFFTGLHSRKQNCTTHTRWGSPRSYLKAQTHTQCKSPSRGRALAPYPKISPAASKPFHRGRENA